MYFMTQLVAAVLCVCITAQSTALYSNSSTTSSSSSLVSDTATLTLTSSSSLLTSLPSSPLDATVVATKFFTNVSTAVITQASVTSTATLGVPGSFSSAATTESLYSSISFLATARPTKESSSTKPEFTMISETVLTTVTICTTYLSGTPTLQTSTIVYTSRVTAPCHKCTVHPTNISIARPISSAVSSSSKLQNATTLATAVDEFTTTVITFVTTSTCPATSGGSLVVSVYTATETLSLLCPHCNPTTSPVSERPQQSIPASSVSTAFPSIIASSATPTKSLKPALSSPTTVSPSLYSHTSTTITPSLLASTIVPPEQPLFPGSPEAPSGSSSLFETTGWSPKPPCTQETVVSSSISSTAEPPLTPTSILESTEVTTPFPSTSADSQYTPTVTIPLTVHRCPGFPTCLAPSPPTVPTYLGPEPSVGASGTGIFAPTYPGPVIPYESGGTTQTMDAISAVVLLSTIFVSLIML